MAMSGRRSSPLTAARLDRRPSIDSWSGWKARHAVGRARSQVVFEIVGRIADKEDVAIPPGQWWYAYVRKSRSPRGASRQPISSKISSTESMPLETLAAMVEEGARRRGGPVVRWRRSRLRRIFLPSRAETLRTSGRFTEDCRPEIGSARLNVEKALPVWNAGHPPRRDRKHRVPGAGVDLEHSAVPASSRSRGDASAAGEPGSERIDPGRTASREPRCPRRLISSVKFRLPADAAGSELDPARFLPVPASSPTELLLTRRRA
jgi:hypothetical protein